MDVHKAAVSSKASDGSSSFESAMSELESDGTNRTTKEIAASAVEHSIQKMFVLWEFVSLKKCLRIASRGIPLVFALEVLTLLTL